MIYQKDTFYFVFGIVFTDARDKVHEEKNCEKIVRGRKVSLKMRNGIFLDLQKEWNQRKVCITVLL